MNDPKNIKIPKGFRYSEVLRRGKPVHEKFDSFSIRHPSMPLEKRAKIFSPFDALKGFREAISAKDVIYEYRKTLSDEDMRVLDQKLCLLRQLTINSKALSLLKLLIFTVWKIQTCRRKKAAILPIVASLEK